jgi:penicillin amidase
MPYVVVDGTDPGAQWQGFLPPEKLPRSRAATEGWVATANNDPWGFTFDGNVHNDPWYYGGFYAAGHRAKRITDEIVRLTGRGGITVEDMQALQTDTHSALSDMLLPVVGEAWAAVETDEDLESFRGDEDLQTLVTLLTEQWDQNMDRTRPGALAFRVWLLMLTEEVIGDELAFLYGEVVKAQPSFVIKFPALAVTGQYEDPDAIVQQGKNRAVMDALDRTAAFLRSRYGGVDPSLYTWGDIHGTKFDNPFGGRLEGDWIPSDGGDDTVNISTSTFLNDEANDVAERFDSHDGAIFRVVTTFGDDGVPQAYASWPIGNSGDPDSPHFKDRVGDWIEGQYEYLPFTREEVDAAAESVITLSPDDHPGS